MLAGFSQAPGLPHSQGSTGEGTLGMVPAARPAVSVLGPLA